MVTCCKELWTEAIIYLVLHGGGVMRKLETLERRCKCLSEERDTDLEGMSQEKPTLVNDD